MDTVGLRPQCRPHAISPHTGHNPPIIARASGAIDRLTPTGLVLGVAPEWTYTSGVVPFERGDRLICFTDGITEAVSPDEVEFGEERLLAVIAETARGSSEALVQAITRAVAAWTHHEPQDDATLIVLSAL